MMNWLCLLLLTAVQVHAKTVRYDLTIENRPVNLSGQKTVDFALMVNGGIPAPTLEFTEGDEAEITVTNKLEKTETSIHWHGILLPPEQDGVSYLNTPPIRAGTSHTFMFKIRQNGTYWYHSHTTVQEQKGVYGAIIIHPKKRGPEKDVVAVLSDWSDENADQIIRNLRKDGDYYQHKKDSVRSYFGALKQKSLGNFLANEWQKMGGMDLSDVGYDAFLINGRRESSLADAKPGEKIRLRIINAAASSYFYVSLGDQVMTVVAADGVDVVPTHAKEILMGMAETYDVLLTVPDNRSLELKATAQDVSGSASLWIGPGEKVPAPTKPKPDFYARMDHSAHKASGGGEHHHHHALESLTVDELKATAPTAFAEKNVLSVKLVLDGDMARYVWHINGRAIHQDRNLEIAQGQVVRYEFENKSMMHHPMHLHGHFFRVLNKNGEYSPLKHTVDVPPHGSRVIEFIADEPGQWMLHCHNLYHMKTGMARVVKYSTWTPSPEIAKLEKHDPHMHDHMYFAGDLLAATNRAEVNLKAMKTWDELELRVELEKGPEWEGDLLYKRWLSNMFYLTAGGLSFDEKQTAAAGFGYILPMIIHSKVLINHEGKIRIDLKKHFQWTKWVQSEVEYKWRPDQGGQEHTIEANLMYAPSWRWSVGATINNHGPGVGARIRF